MDLIEVVAAMPVARRPSPPPGWALRAQTHNHPCARPRLQLLLHTPNQGGSWGWKGMAMILSTGTILGGSI